jgi:hypothetical protein
LVVATWICAIAAYPGSIANTYPGRPNEMRPTSGKIRHRFPSAALSFCDTYVVVML